MRTTSKRLLLKRVLNATVLCSKGLLAEIVLVASMRGFEDLLLPTTRDAEAYTYIISKDSARIGIIKRRELQ